MLPAFRHKRQLDQLHAHEYTCPTPTNPRAQPRVGEAVGYGRVWERESECCNQCHPYFYSSPPRRARLYGARAPGHVRGRDAPANKSRESGGEGEEEHADAGLGAGGDVFRGGAQCDQVDLQVASVLLVLLEEEQRVNGVVCEWCQLHPASPVIVIVVVIVVLIVRVIVIVIVTA